MYVLAHIYPISGGSRAFYQASVLPENYLFDESDGMYLFDETDEVILTDI